MKVQHLLNIFFIYAIIIVSRSGLKEWLKRAQLFLYSIVEIVDQRWIGLRQKFRKSSLTQKDYT